MTTTIQTSRFGNIEITSEHLIEFRNGMIGFPHLRTYVLVESNTMPLLLWLQSTENPAVAFPVVEPWFFKKDYNPRSTEAEKACVALEIGDRTKIFIVLTIPPEMTRMTMNLKAPIVINLSKGLAVQMVIADKGYEVRVPAHEAFASAVAAYNLSQSAESDLPKKESSDSDAWQAVCVKGARETSLPHNA